jgi:hypothetical protein
MAMPAADLSSTPAQQQAGSAGISSKIKVNYGDEAKVNRLSSALDSVKNSQGMALQHVENAKATIPT